jgi:hypothetical protein
MIAVMLNLFGNFRAQKAKKRVSRQEVSRADQVLQVRRALTSGKLIIEVRQ